MNTQNNLLTKVKHAILLTVGLTTQQTGRRINHPLPVTHTENSMTIFPDTGLLSRYVEPHLTGSGAWVGSQRKRPRCALSVGHWFAATRSAFSFKHTEKALTMLFTFIIAYPHAKKAQLRNLRRVHTISAIANTEQEARQQLDGLPLVFVRKTQNERHTRLLTPELGKPIPGCGHPMLVGGAA